MYRYRLDVLNGANSKDGEVACVNDELDTCEMLPDSFWEFLEVRYVGVCNYPDGIVHMLRFFLCCVAAWLRGASAANGSRSSSQPCSHTVNF